MARGTRDSITVVLCSKEKFRVQYYRCTMVSTHRPFEILREARRIFEEKYLHLQWDGWDVLR